MDPERFVIGIDQGSSSTKGLLLSSGGQVVSDRVVEVSTQQISATEIEQDPVELLDSVREVLEGLLQDSKAQSIAVSSIGFTFQRSGVCAWEGASVLHPLLSWRDTRTAARLAEFSARHSEITEKSGLPVTAHYSGGKLALLQQSFPDEKVAVGTLDTWIFSQLLDSGPFITEDTMASRSMLYDLEQADWCPELCKLFGVDINRLPEIRPSLSELGYIEGIPVTASLGDQQAGALGLGSGSPILTLGTIGSVLLPTGHQAVMEKGYISNVFYSAQTESEKPSIVEKQITFQIEATTNCCGRIPDLLVDELKWVTNPLDLNQLCEQSRAKNRKVTGYFALGGSASPYWLTDSPIVIEGWDRKSRSDFVRAAFESLGSAIAFDLLNFKELSPESFSTSSIVVTGGVSRSNYLVQYLADITGLTLIRTEHAHGSTLGAAIAARCHPPRVGGTAQKPLVLCGCRVGGTDFHPSKSSPAPEQHARWVDLQQRVLNGEVSETSVVDLPVVRSL